ncbi:hypothetical protein [Maricaulis maris]|uniref:hypothetical protein n=1 Tax=Maricaulis maris TaxID=74318 RepID=UPI003B8C674E
MPTWPQDLSKKTLRDDHAIDGTDNVIRSTVDRGPAKQRPRYTNPDRGGVVTFRWTRAEYKDEFLPWFEGDLAFGSLSFDGWVEPLTGAAVTARFVGGQPYQPRPAEGGLIDVTIAIEILP